MEPGDTLDALTPAQREQYGQRYVARKLRDGLVPKTPLGWREATASWQARYIQGKTLEKGLDVVFGLTQSGWEREVPRQVDPISGKEIRVDFHLKEDRSTTQVVQNGPLCAGAGIHIRTRGCPRWIARRGAASAERIGVNPAAIGLVVSGVLDRVDPGTVTDPSI